MRALGLRAISLTVGVLLVIGATLPLRPTPVAAAEGDKRPNLQMLTIRDITIETINGRRLLRFTTIFVNAGPGHFELHGSRDSSSDFTMDLRQRMFRWDGTSRFIATRAIGRYAGDGHDHWHANGVVTYETWRLHNATDTARRGAKIGFCALDSTPWDFSLRGARSSPYYRGQWCGTRGSMTNQMGLSVGWGDRYPWNFAFQWIDITGLPQGTYFVRATVDIQDYYHEQRETDNCTWARIQIPPPGSTNRVTVENSGFRCGVKAMTAVTSFDRGDTWDPPRRARIEPGTYTGYQFNSKGTVLRTKRITVRAERSVQVPARGVPPGHAQRYLYTSTGPFEGYWVRPGGGITLLPR